MIPVQGPPSPPLGRQARGRGGGYHSWDMPGDPRRLAAVRESPEAAPAPADETLEPEPRPTHPFLRWLGRRTIGTWFVLLALPMGVFLVFTVPPLQGMDEMNHFFRAYTISDGALLATTHDGRVGGYLPACVEGYAHTMWGMAGEPRPYQRQLFFVQPSGCSGKPPLFRPFENTAYYSPLCYLPHVIGITIARLVHGSAPFIYYAGRLSILLAYIGMFLLAIRIAPAGKPLFLLLGLWPMALQEAATYSADTVTLALAALLTATMLRLMRHGESEPRLVLLAFLIAVGLSLCKIAYVLMTPLLLLIPARAFPSRMPALLLKAGMLAVVALVAGAWFLQVKGITEAAWFPGLDINPHKQVAYILQHPVWYAGFMADGLFGDGTYNSWRAFVSQVSFFRNVIEAGDGLPPPWVLIVADCLLLSVYIRELAGRAFRWSIGGAFRAALPVALMVLTVSAIFSAIYIESTPPMVEPYPGGRYYLPLVGLPLLALMFLTVGRPRQRSAWWMIPFLLAMYAWLGFRIHHTFYT
jgi:Predicted membrane protein (DUF2142)